MARPKFLAVIGQHGLEHGAVAHMQMPVVGLADGDAAVIAPLDAVQPRIGTKVLWPWPIGAAAAASNVSAGL